MTVEDLRFTPALLTKPAPRRLTVESTLEHFAIVTYRVDPEALRRHLHPRFEPDCIAGEGGGRDALLSVVTFLDRDFRFLACPWARFRFGQTNYRAYVRDGVSGEHVVWFFGTCLDSISVLLARHAWKLPWHRSRMRFDCRYDERTRRYERYRVETRSAWSPARLALEDSGEEPRALAGFDSVEAGLVILTHPLKGYFSRRDGALGTYGVWHERLRATQGRVIEASYPLLDRLGLVPDGSTERVHSVLIQPAIEFTIALPPVAVGAGRG